MTSGSCSVAVVTDGAAALPACAIDTLEVCVVPMTVALEDQVYADADLSPRAVVAHAAPGRVTTAAPSPGAYLEVLEHLAGRPVVIATVARSMSASYDSALAAARYVDGRPVTVVDTGTAAGAQGLVVLAAARAARAGGSAAEVAETVRSVGGRVRLLAFLEQLDYLARSGRVPGIAARMGRSLGARAMFEFSGGRIRRRRPAGSTTGALARIVAACRAGESPGARLHAAVLDAQCPVAADALTSQLSGFAPGAELYAAPFSSVMVAHTGPGLAGLAWWWEPRR